MIEKINCGIYKIVNLVNSKIYVGSSINLKSRKYAHFNTLLKNRHDNNYLQNAYNKYGKENFKWEVIEYIDKLEDKKELKKILLDKEQYWINSLKVCNKNIGYNLAPVAGNCLGIVPSEETRRKMSESQKRRHLENPHLEETKNKIGKAHKGKKVSQETKDKLSKAHKGNKYSLGRIPTEENRKNMSVAQKGKKRSQESIQRRKDTMSKKTREEMLKIQGKVSKKVINVTTKEIFNSISEAARTYNVSISNISKVCRKREGSIKNCIWRYLDEYNDNIEYTHINKRIKKVVNISTNKVFNSITEASLYYNISISKISAVCRGGRKTAGKYKWKYFEEGDINEYKNN